MLAGFLKNSTSRFSPTYLNKATLRGYKKREYLGDLIVTNGEAVLGIEEIYSIDPICQRTS